MLNFKPMIQFGRLQIHRQDKILVKFHHCQASSAVPATACGLEVWNNMADIQQALQETANWLFSKSYKPWPLMTCLHKTQLIFPTNSHEVCACTTLMKTAQFVSHLQVGALPLWDALNFFTKSHDALVLHGAQSPSLHSTAEQPEDFSFSFSKCYHAIKCSDAIVGLLSCHSIEI